jgi:hypothetical protein
VAFSVSMTGSRELIARLGKVSPQIREASRRSLALIGERLASYGKTTAWDESGLHVRTGDLRRTEAAMPVEETPRGLRGGMIASQSLPYGPIQDQGGVIRAVNATYLTIPLDEALTPSGVAKFGARDAEAAGYTTFVRNHIIFGIKGGVLYPLFLLVPSVIIPASHFVSRILQPNIPMIERTLKQGIDEAIRETK